MICKLLVILLFSVTHVWATRHAIVFTDGKTDDILAHQVLEVRGEYDSIHFISEGVEDHLLAHRSIQTGREFYGAKTPAYHYTGKNVLGEEVPHERVFRALQENLAELPQDYLGELQDLGKYLPIDDEHRIDIFHHAPTSADEVNYILNTFPGQVDRYHLVHGYNSAQDNDSRDQPTKSTMKFLTQLKGRVKSSNPHALFVATAGSSSFSEPSDGVTLLKVPFDHLVPKFHNQATMKEPFYARQIEKALRLLSRRVPQDIVEGYRHGLQGLVETARGSESTPSRSAARDRGVQLINEMSDGVKAINTRKVHDGLISRLDKSVIKAFTDDCRIEACDAMHTLHVLEKGYSEGGYDPFKFYQSAPRSKIVIQEVDHGQRNHGRSLFRLSEDATSLTLQQILGGTVSSQPYSYVEPQGGSSMGPSSSQASTSKRRKQRRNPYQKRALGNNVAFALDIDGVLKHGDTVLPGAKDAIGRLVAKKIPFILLTNGGGISEQDRAKKLSEQLEVVINPKSLILGRTPMKALAQDYANDPVLVTGTKGGDSKIMRDYGFQKVYTVAEVQQWNERIFPFSKLRKEQCTNSLSINGEDIVFKAFFFLQESDDWGRDMQYAVDLMSPPYGSIVAGKPKAESAEEPLREKDRPKLYYASADLLTPTEGISRPRLGMGAIKLSLESIYDKLFYPSTGQRLEEMTVTYGKPSKMTYEYASKVFKEEHGVEKGDYTIWMIGDNPDVDIKGANRAGWKSALVKTGVYQKNEMPTEEPTLFVDNVLEAVDKILALHPIA